MSVYNKVTVDRSRTGRLRSGLADRQARRSGRLCTRCDRCRMTPAHHTDKFAELVCSNSLRANSLTNAVGVLKEEMRMLDSLIIRSADRTCRARGRSACRRPGRVLRRGDGGASQHPLIEVRNEEITSCRDGITVVATGPLTSPALSEKLQRDDRRVLSVLLRCSSADRREGFASIWARFISLPDMIREMPLI